MQWLILIGRKLIRWVGVAAAMPPVCLFRVLRPLIEVRYGYIYADRIGHFAFDLEFYLTESKIFPPIGRTIDLFFLLGRPCNAAIHEMMKRHVVVNSFVEYLFAAEKLIPGKRNLIYPARLRTGSTDPQGLFSKIPPQLTFSDRQSEEGLNYLRSIGCSGDERIVCLIVRDPAYLDRTRSDRDWGYHKYRDSNIDNYKDVARHLAEKGYWVFRMGKIVEHRFTVDHPRVIDYANSDQRSDLLDVWLLSRCSFVISTSVGLDSVADAFRKPLVFVNFLPLAWFQTWSHCMLAPSHLYWRSSGRELTCHEHLLNSYLRNNDYDSAGIDVAELSSIEILNVVKEFEEALTLGSDLELNDQLSQRRFWHIFFDALESGETSRVGTVLPEKRRIPEIKGRRVVHAKARLSLRYLEGHPAFLNNPRP